MTTKLTKWARDEIARKAVAHAFDPRVEALAIAEDALAREAYNQFIPAEERALMATVPANWLRLDSCLRFNVGGLTIVLNTRDSGLPVPYRMPGRETGGYGCHVMGVIPHGDLCDRIQKHAHAIEDVRRERREALSAIEQLLRAVTTIGKLKEVWPQGAQFYADLEERPASSLPAVRIEEVNAMLGLPQAA